MILSLRFCSSATFKVHPLSFHMSMTHIPSQNVLSYFKLINVIPALYLLTSLIFGIDNLVRFARHSFSKILV